MTPTDTTIKIGGFSEGHLLVQAKKVIDRKSGETPIFDVEAEHRIPKLDNDELTIGKVLGRGGFCKVSEVVKIALKDGIAAKCEKERIQHDEQHFANILQDRDFMQAYYLRKGTDYRYAIKVLKEDALKDVQTYINGVVDLAIEARFLSVIRHPNIIKMRAFSSGTPLSRDFFIVLDRLFDILSRTLLTWAKRKVVGVRKVFDLQGKKASEFWVERISVAYDLANALTHLHSLNIVYRDLKPDNIGFDVRGDVKIFDFGLSRQLPTEKDEDGTYKMTGDTGSMRYMAPEIFLFQPYNETVDVYAFGILLHQICSLEKPFEGFTKKMFDKLVTKGGQRPKCDPKWSPRIQTLLQQCWNVDISKRPAMRHVWEALGEELSQYSGDVPRLRDPTDESGKTQHSLHMRKDGSTRSKKIRNSSKSSAL